MKFLILVILIILWQHLSLFDKFFLLLLTGYVTLLLKYAKINHTNTDIRSSKPRKAALKQVSYVILKSRDTAVATLTVRKK